MSYASLLGSIPQVGSKKKARALLEAMRAVGLTVVPTAGFRDVDELLADLNHAPLCEAMRPDDEFADLAVKGLTLVAPLMSYPIDP